MNLITDWGQIAPILNTSGTKFLVPDNFPSNIRSTLNSFYRSRVFADDFEFNEKWQNKLSQFPSATSCQPALLKMDDGRYAPLMIFDTPDRGRVPVYWCDLEICPLASELIPQLSPYLGYVEQGRGDYVYRIGEKYTSSRVNRAANKVRNQLGAVTSLVSPAHLSRADYATCYKHTRVKHFLDRWGHDPIIAYSLIPYPVYEDAGVLLPNMLRLGLREVNGEQRGIIVATHTIKTPIYGRMFAYSLIERRGDKAFWLNTYFDECYKGRWRGKHNLLYYALDEMIRMCSLDNTPLSGIKTFNLGIDVYPYKADFTSNIEYTPGYATLL